ncbi:hypothetical protein OGATHE_002705 [Ogataea polymorpha]|uniref:Uncharacterized protein n=1 Tax=Ogataea polymorpha TaxID=460523 RepID=A0A9P8PCT3_9ASCO|nr:hypothetical protein OGATHE_002705 [Ogataea polymorpha]
MTNAFAYMFKNIHDSRISELSCTPGSLIILGRDFETPRKGSFKSSISPGGLNLLPENTLIGVELLESKGVVACGLDPGAGKISTRVGDGSDQEIDSLWVKFIQYFNARILEEGENLLFDLWIGITFWGVLKIDSAVFQSVVPFLFP